MYRLSIEVFIMEYMLMHDGSVKVFDQIHTSFQVRTALHVYEGVDYYWLSDGQWYRIPVGSAVNGGSKVHDVPEVILLAAMLS
jgi:hypothetical protein